MVQSMSSLLLITIICLLSLTPLVATDEAEPAHLESLLRNPDSHVAPEQVVISGLADVTTFTRAAVAEACEGPTERCSSRHKDEKERLLDRIARDRGTWNENHPRWRLLKAIDGFRSYRQANKAEVDRWRDAYRHVSKSQKKLLETSVNYRQKLNDLDHLIDRNGLLCDGIARHALAYYSIPEAELACFVLDEAKGGPASRTCQRCPGSEALRTGLVRRGPGQGARPNVPVPCCGRLRGYTRTVRAAAATTTLRARLCCGSCCRERGWGRLGYEIAEMGGFEVTINEWSKYMIAAYRHLEANHAPWSHTLHPFIDSLSHHATTADLKRPVMFPEGQPDDDDPSSTTTLIDDPSKVLLVEGDFTTVISSPPTSSTMSRHLLLPRRDAEPAELPRDHRPVCCGRAGTG
ncbi:hypothetical protein PG994_005402 [Apiospora phragmitis]|uniref:Uncharacterized protein n=1 Tax=Apiospora phragmitis TaxID=2905665 RepID=A0ABR1VC53_9PEZI